LEGLIGAWSNLMDHPDFPGAGSDFQMFCHDRAALALCWRAAEKSDPNDLDAARVHLDRVIAGQPNWSHDLHYHLGIYYYNCAAIAGRQEDAQRAVTILRKLLVELPPNESRLRPRCLDVLGRSLLWLHDRDSRLADLNEGIELLRASLLGFAVDAPYRRLVATATAAALHSRFKGTGRLADLDAAINVLICETSSSSFANSTALGHSMCGMLLRDRFRTHGDIGDLKDSLAWHERAVAVSPKGGRIFPIALTNQGNCLLTMFEHCRDTQFLYRSLQIQYEAVEITRPEDKYYPSRLNNLANCLTTTFDTTSDASYLDQSIELYGQAIALAPPTDPDLPSRHYNRANSLAHRHELSRRRHDRDAAMHHYREACRSGLTLAAEWTLGAALAWGRWTSVRGLWIEAKEAYDFGMRAVEQLFVSQTSRYHKETWLRSAQGLSTQAAYAYVRNGHAEAAVVVQERGRALLLAEALGHRGV